MIYQYDLVRDEHLKPSLRVLKEINVDEKVQYGLKDTIVLLKVVYAIDTYAAEHNFIVAYSDTDTILGIYCMAIGDYESCPVYHRETAMFLALTGAVSFAMFHNHPNNNVIASDEDKGAAAAMELLGNAMDIKFKASCIIGKSGWKKTSDDPIIVRFYDDEFDIEED